jgi:uncharacterized heparinase superfamily protein
MPLILGQSNSLWYPVKGSLVAEDGTSAPYEIQVQIPRLSRDTLESLHLQKDSSALLPKSDAAIAGDLVMDWRGVTDPEGAAIPFTPENLAAVLQICPIASDVVAAIYEAHSPEGRRKN